MGDTPTPHTTLSPSSSSPPTSLSGSDSDDDEDTGKGPIDVDSILGVINKLYANRKSILALKKGSSLLPLPLPSPSPPPPFPLPVILPSPLLPPPPPPTHHPSSLNEMDQLAESILQKEKEDIAYFKEEHRKVYDSINRIGNTDISLHDRIIGKKGMPIYIKAIAITKLKNAGPENGSLEYTSAARWIENLLKIPFGQYKENSINIENPDLMQYCKDKFSAFDAEIYGMADVKEEIIAYLVDFITSPRNRKPVLGLYGGPGVGKTKILKMFSSILGLPLETLKFGGKKNPEQFEGQDPVYVSSSYGDITAILIKTQCMNPIIILEEIDKISQHHANEIYGVLAHLLDPEQNDEFKDKYFPEISMDISRAVFGVTYNDRSLVSPIVLDRIKEITIHDKTLDEKVEIVKMYLLPHLLSKYGLKKQDIYFDSDDTIRYIINNKTETQGGLRKLSDNIYEIVRKINTLLKLYSDGKVQENILNLSFYVKEIVERGPSASTGSGIVITKHIVEILLKGRGSISWENFHSMYS
jgi:ATP-dependent Lon protease